MHAYSLLHERERIPSSFWHDERLVSMFKTPESFKPMKIQEYASKEYASFKILIGQTAIETLSMAIDR